MDPPTYEVCCLYGFFVDHILSYFGSIFIIVNMVVCFVCVCLFCKLCIFIMFTHSYCNVYVFLLLCMFYSVFCFIVLFCVLFYVSLCNVLVPPGVNLSEDIQQSCLTVTINGM